MTSIFLQFFTIFHAKKTNCVFLLQFIFFNSTFHLFFRNISAISWLNIFNLHLFFINFVVFCLFYACIYKLKKLVCPINATSMIKQKILLLILKFSYYPKFPEKTCNFTTKKGLLHSATVPYLCNLMSETN